MAIDNGTPKSVTLGVVVSMGYTPIAISLLEGEEVFVFKSQEEASEVEEDFSPEGIWVGESELSELDKKKLKKVYNLVEKESPKIGVISKDEPLKTSISGNVYCFTGFRNPVLETNIEAMGASVEPRVTNRTTHLIMADTSKITAKARSAMAKGCILLDLTGFVYDTFDRDTYLSGEVAGSWKII